MTSFAMAGVFKSTENIVSMHPITTRNVVKTERPVEIKNNQKDVIHFQPGMPVFVPCQREGWKSGVVTQVDGRHIHVKFQNAQECSFLSSQIDLRNSVGQYNSVRDLVQLSPLSPPAVLECLRQRFSSDKLYTKAGSTVVAVNPFKPVPGLYDSSVIGQYSQELTDLPLAPHVYAVAQRAHRRLMCDLETSNQSIIVSGESGAGKTVSAKHLMKYLVTVANKMNDGCHEVGSQIEKRILESNPLLEAFGNAKTTRNQNSSRFGKFIELIFNRNGTVEGGCIETYLLEKTRVAYQADNEFNFHIFYQLLRGADSDYLAQFGIDQVLKQQFLIGKGCIRKEGKVLQDHLQFGTENDVENWQTTLEAMDDIGLDRMQQDQIFQILSAILHLCNIEFIADPEDEDICIIDPASTQSAETASRLLDIDEGKLQSSFSYRQITANHRKRHSVFHKPCTLDETRSRRDCLAKLLYSRLFDWLVEVINISIKCKNSYKSIGILDIYGFESFERNSLEQLCINYANERLQQHYVKHFLRDLQDDYDHESVPWTFTEFVDNTPCLNLLEGNPSVFALLDEECHLNRPSNSATLCQRLLTTFENNCYFQRTRRNQNEPAFIIRHYAEPVTYTLCGVIDKNKDNIPAELVSLLQESHVQLISHLFDKSQTETGGVKKKTVLAKFKASLDRLLDTLNASTPNYLRCIKPNKQSLAGRFDGAYVLSQLHACGVLETVQVCRLAHAARIPYLEFLRQYGIILQRGSYENVSVESSEKEEERENRENELLFEPLELLHRKQLSLTPRKKSSTPKRKLRRRTGLSSCDHTRKLCASIMRIVFGVRSTQKTAQNAQFGRTKLFLKQGQIQKLESMRASLLCQQAGVIQRAWRSYKLRKQRKLEQAAIVLQSSVRGWLARRQIAIRLRAIRVLQRYARRYLSRKIVTITSVQTQHTEVEDTVDNVLATPVRTPLNGTLSQATDDEGSYLIQSERTPQGYMYHVMQSPSQNHPKCHPAKDVYRLVSAAATGAYLTQGTFQMSGAFTGLPYVEAHNGVISRRRMPRVQIRFHTKINPVLKYGHYLPQRELQCSLSDCLEEQSK